MRYPARKPAILMLTLFLVSFLFVFATNTKTKTAVTVRVAASTTVEADALRASAKALYADLHLEEAGLKEDIFTSALTGMEKLENRQAVANDKLLTIIDFSQPSDKKRLYVLDLEHKRTVFHTLVAHGKNTGQLWATSFSNKLSSLKSSPGFYITAETYMGENGYSLRLDGQEKNINDNARRRAIVMHGAYYANESTVESLGFLGRSWGCPAVPMQQHRAIIDSIKGGSVLFIYTADSKYKSKSQLI